MSVPKFWRLDRNRALPLLPLGELITSQLATVADLIGSRITVSGELDFVISPAAAETIELAVHELSTNARKYGALSGVAGNIRIAWAIQRKTEHSSLTTD